MREQDPKIRRNNFDEVSFGYSQDEAIAEASRCIQCKNPTCVSGCPVEIDIPAFILAIKEKRFADSIEIIKQTNKLPAVCGRVCPQEDQCEKLCILAKKDQAINIGYLERFAADWQRENDNKPNVCPYTSNPNRQKVAVIGAGPAGLTCASELCRLGYKVTIFEALHKPGGVLTYGIPEFRLPKAIVMDEVAQIVACGVEIKYNYIIGNIKSIDDLRQEGFKAFYIASGAGLPYFTNIPGENLNGVYSANEFLTRINLMKAYKFPEYDTPVNFGKRVVVIGAGNVAMDVARCALRLGAERVGVLYRRTQEQMPARLEEIHHAEQEGAHFHVLTSPVEMIGGDSGEVQKLICIRNKLGAPDASGRRRPEAIPGSEFEMIVNTVIVAIGNGSNPVLLKSIKGLSLNKWGNVNADESTCATNIEDIFAGGDIVTGAATVIAAMGAGRIGATSIDKYLKK